MSSRWRRPSALLLALLLARSAALGAGAAAATAASQCSGTTSPWCKANGDSGCSTSSDLSAAECSAWVDLYDKAGGAGWTDCSQNRLDPCACDVNAGGVECQNSQITTMYARARLARPAPPGPIAAPALAAAAARPPVHRRRG